MQQTRRPIPPFVSIYSAGNGETTYRVHVPKSATYFATVDSSAPGGFIVERDHRPIREHAAIENVARIIREAVAAKAPTTVARIQAERIFRQ